MSDCCCYWKEKNERIELFKTEIACADPESCLECGACLNKKRHFSGAPATQYVMWPFQIYSNGCRASLFSAFVAWFATTATNTSLFRSRCETLLLSCFQMPLSRVRFFTTLYRVHASLTTFCFCTAVVTLSDCLLGRDVKWALSFVA